jgi:hypothetical protein
VEHMDNQQFGWVAQQLDAAEHQQQHAQPNLDSAVSQEHLGPAHVAYTQYQHRGDQTMVGISGVRTCSVFISALIISSSHAEEVSCQRLCAGMQQEQSELLEAISGNEADLGLAYSALEALPPNQHTGVQELQRSDIITVPSFPVSSSRPGGGPSSAVVGLPAALCTLCCHVAVPRRIRRCVNVAMRRVALLPVEVLAQHPAVCPRGGGCQEQHGNPRQTINLAQQQGSC